MKADVCISVLPYYDQSSVSSAVISHPWEKVLEAGHIS